MGLTFVNFNFTVLPLEFSISEKNYRDKLFSEQAESSQQALNVPET